jgi:hypothetical protein
MSRQELISVLEGRAFIVFVQMGFVLCTDLCLWERNRQRGGSCTATRWSSPRALGLIGSKVDDLSLSFSFWGAGMKPGPPTCWTSSLPGGYIPGLQDGHFLMGQSRVTAS